MSQKHKPAGTSDSSTLLNYVSIKPKIPKINETPNSQKLFASPSTSDIVGNYENFSSCDLSLFVDKNSTTTKVFKFYKMFGSPIIILIFLINKLAI
jgi:hypothetical protein